MTQAKDAKNILEEMEERDKELVRAVRAPAVAKETEITFIDASTTRAGDKFNMSLFCDTGAAIDICSMKTVMKRGARLEYKQTASNIQDVQRGVIH